MNTHAKTRLESRIATGNYTDQLLQPVRAILSKNGISELLEYLAAAHGLSVSRVLMSNPKAPDYLIIVNGLLPMEELKERFSMMPGMRLTEFEIVFLHHYASVIGDGAL